jgi:hypothetical protein
MDTLLVQFSALHTHPTVVLVYSASSPSGSAQEDLFYSSNARGFQSVAGELPCTYSCLGVCREPHLSYSTMEVAHHHGP